MALVVPLEDADASNTVTTLLTLGSMPTWKKIVIGPAGPTTEPFPTVNAGGFDGASALLNGDKSVGTPSMTGCGPVWNVAPTDHGPST